MKIFKAKYRKILLKLVSTALAVVMLALILPLNSFAAQGEEKVNESISLNEFLEAIYSETLSNEEVSQLAESIEDDYKILDENIADANILNELKNLADNYFYIREQSYITTDNISTDMSLSEQVKNDENTRRIKLAEFAEDAELEVLQANSTIRVENVSVTEEYIELAVYEWIFFTYSQDGFEDISGYGVDHIMRFVLVEGVWSLERDAYKDDGISVYTSSSYIEPESSVETVDEETQTQEPAALMRNALAAAYSVSSYASYTYYPSDAVAYSDKYALTYNTAYGNYNSRGGDCANFVSQCLHAGGLPMTDSWHWYSYSNATNSWVGATGLFNYLADDWGKVIYSPSESQLEAGNPIFYGNIGSTSYLHASLCVGRNSSGKPIINQHNTDKWHANWSWGSGYRYTTIDIYSDSSAGEPTGPSTLSATNITYPTQINQGSSFGVRGIITSNYTITRVKVAVIDQSGKEVISQTRTPNSRSYDLLNVNNDVRFGTLAAGCYKYHIEASDASGTTKVLHSAWFNVGFAQPGKPVITVKAGTVSSNTVISWGATSNTTRYEIAINKSSGESVLGKTSVTGTSYSILLGEGSYTVTLTAINDKYYNCTAAASPVSFTIKAPVLDHIAITSKPTKLEYIDGEQLDLTGLSVTAYYNDGSYKTVSDYNVSGFTSGEGVKNITVEYGGKTASFEVIVKSAQKPGIFVSGADAKAGQTVKIGVYVENNAGFKDMKLNIGYDETKITPVSISKGTAIKDGTVRYETDGISNGLTAYVNNNADVKEDGALFYITFRVSASEQLGEIPITVSYNSGDIKNSAGASIEYELSNGRIKVTEIADSEDYYANVLSSPSYVVANEVFVVQIETSDKIVDIELYNENNNVLGSTIISKSVNDGKILWTVSTSLGTDDQQRSCRIFVKPEFKDFVYSGTNIELSVIKSDITYASPDKNEFPYGDPVDVTVTVTRNLNVIKFVNENGSNVSYLPTSVTVNGDGTVTYKCRLNIETVGERVITAVASDANGSMSSSQKMSFTIYKPSNFVSATFNKSAAMVDESLYLTVVAESGVSSVSIFNELDRKIGATCTSKTESDNGRSVYVFRMSIGTVGIDRVFYVKGYNSSGDEVDTIVSDPISITDSSPSILSIEPNKTKVKVNEKVTVKVGTNTYTDIIDIKSTTGLKMGKVTRRTYRNDGVIDWEYEMSIGTAGNKREFDVIASNASNSQGIFTSQKLYLEVYA